MDTQCSQDGRASQTLTQSDRALQNISKEDFDKTVELVSVPWETRNSLLRRGLLVSILPRELHCTSRLASPALSEWPFSLGGPMCHPEWYWEMKLFIISAHPSLGDTHRSWLKKYGKSWKAAAFRAFFSCSIQASGSKRLTSYLFLMGMKLADGAVNALLLVGKLELNPSFFVSRQRVSSNSQRDFTFVPLCSWLTWCTTCWWWITRKCRSKKPVRTNLRWPLSVGVDISSVSCLACVADINKLVLQEKSKAFDAFMSKAEEKLHEVCAHRFKCPCRIREWRSICIQRFLACGWSKWTADRSRTCWSASFRTRRRTLSSTGQFFNIS